MNITLRIFLQILPTLCFEYYYQQYPIIVNNTLNLNYLFYSRYI